MVLAPGGALYITTGAPSWTRFFVAAEALAAADLGREEVDCDRRFDVPVAVTVEAVRCVARARVDDGAVAGRRRAEGAPADARVDKLAGSGVLERGSWELDLRRTARVEAAPAATISERPVVRIEAVAAAASVERPSVRVEAAVADSAEEATRLFFMELCLALAMGVRVETPPKYV